jgi:hypothetical protein
MQIELAIAGDFSFLGAVKMDLSGFEKHLFALVGVIAAYLVKDLAKWAYDYTIRKRSPSREEFIKLTEALNNSTSATTKMASDIQRIYLFLKVIGGEQWPTHFEKVKKLEEEEKILRGQK